MSDDTDRRILITTFIIAVAFLTWQEIKNKTVPRPARYVGAGVIWGLLGLLGPVLTYPVASMFSIAMLLVLLYQTLNTTPQVTQGFGQYNGPGSTVPRAQ